MSDLEKQIQIIKAHVREYPDFPKSGILFRYVKHKDQVLRRCRDLFSVFQNPDLIASLREVLVSFSSKIEPPVECVIGIESRGFLLGPLIALELKVPFVPIRKKGKLPGNVVAVSYSLEYGEDTLEIQSNSIKKGHRVLIVDDLLATGGSLRAACQLVEALKGKVSACLVLMELTELKGRSQVPTEVLSVIKY